MEGIQAVLWRADWDGFSCGVAGLGSKFEYPGVGMMIETILLNLKESEGQKQGMAKTTSG
jgi:hypothetical protein